MAAQVWQWVRLKADSRGERRALISPYHPEIVKEGKRRMGEFKYLNMGDGKEVKGWVLRAEHKEPMDAFCQALWPPHEAREERVVAYECSSTFASSEAPKLDGLELVRFERDGCHIASHPDVLEVIEGKLRTGGSARNPTLWGHLVIRAKVRPEAKAAWHRGETAVYTPEGWAERQAALAAGGALPVPSPCPSGPEGNHEPDWRTIAFGRDDVQGTARLWVLCRHCQQQACFTVGPDELDWPPVAPGEAS